MDRVADRDRSSRKFRDERDPDRDLDRDRDHKHRHRHDDEKRHESRDRHRPSKKNDEDDESRDEKRPDGDRHRRSKDEKDRQRRSRADSPQEVSPRREPSSDRFRGSVERPKDHKHTDGERRRRYKDDSPQDPEPPREPSSDRFRGSVERPKDEKHGDGERRRRYRDDSPQDLAPKHKKSSDKHTKDEKHRDRERERSSDGVRDSVERGRVSREESVERHHHSARKRKEHDVVEEDSDKRGKRVKGSDGSRDDRDSRREGRRFADRAVDDEDNRVYRAERTRERISKDNMKGERMDVEEDRERKSRVDKDEFNEEEDRKSRRERRRFNDGTNTEKRREEYGMDEDVKGDDSKTIGERKSSTLLGRNGELSKSAMEKSGSAKVSQEPLTSKVPMTSAASSLPIPTKVSLITTTNENGVNITRSDEVPGKSSTDGTATLVSGRSGTLDALAKAKKTLQLQKELNEKLKKISMLNKLGTTNVGMNSQAAGNKTGFKIPSSVVASTTSATVSFVQATSGSATSESISAAAGMGVIPGAPTSTNFEAVKRAQELAAKMGFRQDPEFAPLINMFPGPATADAALPEKPAKAPVLRLDAQGREIDEHGHVMNMPKLTNLSTLKVNINKQKKDAFQILRPDLDADTKSNPHFDPAMGIDKMKLLRPKRMTFQFVDEGRWSKQAELIKFKNQFGEAQAKELKMKQSQLAKAKGEIDNPNLIEVPDRFDRVPKDKKKDEIPEIEWWDKPLLPSGSYIDIRAEGVCLDKINIYVEHPRPIEPPAEPAPPPPQPLKLTKKEQKKLRTQRRLAKEKDRQEMIRQGLIEPPKSKVKMSNLMKVLGSEATQDPTRLEMEIRSAAAEREQAHVDRNIARKLTPSERRKKKERKLFEDPNTLETFVSVYKIKDLSHPKTRFKVDVNAQENRLSGVAVISDGITVVVVEGGRKSINRYGKLMLNRIDWAAAVGNDEEGAENRDMPVNSCGLVWQGTVARPSFHRFTIHQCRTDSAAKKVFADAGVPHYWDLAINFTDDVL